MSDSTVMIVAGLAGFSVMLAVLAWAESRMSGRRVLVEQLATLDRARIAAAGSPTTEKEWQARVRTVAEMLQRVGAKREAKAEAPAVRSILQRAGYKHPNMVAVYWGARMALALGLTVFSMVVFPLLGAGFVGTVFLAAYGGLAGWYYPVFHVRRQVRTRQRMIQAGLPDALDLLVICVEAGLGLNQALLRVADQMHEVHQVMSEELSQVNFEIRAGVPRETALRNLGVRTDLNDVKALSSMMVQSDRFGTPIAHALRVHADSLRLKRRQRAEEVAAKATVKLLFPLVLFIFPALFVVVLGPAMLSMSEAFGSLQ